MMDSSTTAKPASHPLEQEDLADFGRSRDVHDPHAVRTWLETMLAPSVRNSALTFRSASQFKFSSAVVTAAPLASARTQRQAFLGLLRIIHRGCARTLFAPQIFAPQSARDQTATRGATEIRCLQARQELRFRASLEENDSRGRRHSKHAERKPSRQQNSSSVAKSTANKRKQNLLAHKKCTD